MDKFKLKKGTVKLFFDFEFTGLHQNTTPISLGVVADNGKEFYCEFTDYDKKQIDPWLQENIIDKLTMQDEKPETYHNLGSVTFVKGNTAFIRNYLLEWLKQFTYVEFWGDCMWYDGVLLNRLLGGAFSLPNNVYYIYFDIGTLFRFCGVDPDIHRESFIDRPVTNKHNALADAEVIQACYDKLLKNRDDYLRMV